MIGWLGFGRTDDPSGEDFEFGYALVPSAWGRGLMREALAAALDFMFGALGADTVFGECETTNGASRRVMKKAGMQLVETRRELGEAKEICRFAARRLG